MDSHFISIRSFRHLCRHRFFTALGTIFSLSIFSSQSFAAINIQGQVVDTNGNPVAQAQIIFDREEKERGASVVTVFSATDGSFSFPDTYTESANDDLDITVRIKRHRQPSQFT